LDVVPNWLLGRTPPSTPPYGVAGARDTPRIPHTLATGGDVVGSIPVGVGNDPAPPADEKPLLDTVSLVDVAALGAHLRGCVSC
jgi:hypothetical protein